MNLVDSSGWLEYFKGTPQAENFALPGWLFLHLQL